MPGAENSAVTAVFLLAPGRDLDGPIARIGARQGGKEDRRPGRGRAESSGNVTETPGLQFTRRTWATIHAQHLGYNPPADSTTVATQANRPAVDC
jgi:hypothetical protein